MFNDQTKRLCKKTAWRKNHIVKMRSQIFVCGWEGQPNHPVQ